MKLHLVYGPDSPASLSPYRLLDAQRARGPPLSSLRAYAYDLLHFARWAQGAPRRQAARPLTELQLSALIDYVRWQRDQNPPSAPQTICHRLSVLRCLYRFHYGREIPAAPAARLVPRRRAAPSARAAPDEPPRGSR